MTPEESRLAKIIIALAANPHICLSDKVYDVRDSAGGWDDPAVTAWSEACDEADKVVAQYQGKV